MLKQMFKTVNFGFFFFIKKFQIIFTVVVLLKILYCIYMYFVYVCVLCVDVHTHPHAQVWGSEDNCGELALFIHYVGSRDLT